LAPIAECRCEIERKAAGHPPYQRSPDVAGDVQSTKVININATVKVKLTEVGTARWRGKHNVTRTELELPLWELMAEFGPGLYMGMSQMYFVDNEIEICDA